MGSTYASLGFVMKEQGMYSDALEMYTRALSAEPEDDESAWNIRDLEWLLCVEDVQLRAGYERMWGTTEGYVDLRE